MAFRFLCRGEGGSMDSQARQMAPLAGNGLQAPALSKDRTESHRCFAGRFPIVAGHYIHNSSRGP
jgi:hypothetical protein